MGEYNGQDTSGLHKNKVLAKNDLFKDLQKDGLYALVIVDMDKFRKINRFYGYSVATNIFDEMIKRIYTCMCTETQIEGYTLYKLHLGGCGILIKQNSKSIDFDTLADIIYTSLTMNPYKFNSHIINISVSIGISLYSHLI